MRRFLKAVLTLNIALIIFISNNTSVAAGPGGGNVLPTSSSISDPKTEEM